MIGYNFIFSNHISFRLSRHLIFWLFISVWYILLCGFPFFHRNFSIVLALLYSRLPVCIIATYVTLYFLIPRFLFRKKYKQFILTLAVLSIVFPALLFYVFLPWLGEQMEALTKIRISLLDGLGLSMAISGFAAVIKLMKTYYIENSENERLQQQKTSHELQLLKSQLNSRFLFNTLKSIQRHVHIQSPGSSGLILKLSDLLSYILYENDDTSVPLHKEIEIIEGYLELEKEGHGNKIDIQVTKHGDVGEKRIVPLVLLPLVACCFEHSSINQKKDAGISLDFDVTDLVLLVTLNINNMLSFSKDVFLKSLRLKNVKQRLKLYYSGKHQLEIREEDDNYIVQLEMGL